MHEGYEHAKRFPRTLTVRGTGRLAAKPDLIQVSVALNTRDKEYSAAMERAAAMQAALRDALAPLGFEREELKTLSLNVNAEYESVRDERNQYRQVFAGYVCRHDLQLEFGYDTKLLSEVLSAVSACVAEPELRIGFTVKDREPLADELLRLASENALKKAAVLAAASGVSLCELLRVDYSEGASSFFSPTVYAESAGGALKRNMAVDMDVEARDIELCEDVTFVWRID